MLDFDNISVFQIRSRHIVCLTIRKLETKHHFSCFQVYINKCFLQRELELRFFRKRILRFWYLSAEHLLREAFKNNSFEGWKQQAWAERKGELRQRYHRGNEIWQRGRPFRVVPIEEIGSGFYAPASRLEKVWLGKASSLQQRIFSRRDSAESHQASIFSAAVGIWFSRYR